LAEKVPPAQLSQLAAFGLERNLPASHCVHEADLAAEYIPSEQDTQAVEPCASWYFPAAQNSHKAALAALE